MLSPKFDNIRTQLEAIDFTQIRKDTDYLLKDINYRYVNDMLQVVHSKFNFNLATPDRCFLNLMWYLFYIEGLFSFMINIIIFYELSINCHDLLTEYGTIKFITKYEELNDVSLSTKLKFLRKRDYSEIADLCHRPLRNAIAYNDFVVLKTAEVKITSTGKKIHYSKIEKNIGDLRMFQSLFNTYYFRAEKVE